MSTLYKEESPKENFPYPYGKLIPACKFLNEKRQPSRGAYTVHERNSPSIIRFDSKSEDYIYIYTDTRGNYVLKYNELSRSVKEQLESKYLDSFIYNFDENPGFTFYPQVEIEDENTESILNEDIHFVISSERGEVRDILFYILYMTLTLTMMTMTMMIPGLKILSLIH